MRVEKRKTKTLDLASQSICHEICLLRRFLNIEDFHEIYLESHVSYIWNSIKIESSHD